MMESSGWFVVLIALVVNDSQIYLYKPNNFLIPKGDGSHTGRKNGFTQVCKLSKYVANLGLQI